MDFKLYILKMVYIAPFNIIWFARKPSCEVKQFWVLTSSKCLGTNEYCLMLTSGLLCCWPKCDDFQGFKDITFQKNLSRL